MCERNVHRRYLVLLLLLVLLVLLLLFLSCSGGGGGAGGACAGVVVQSTCSGISRAPPTELSAMNFANHSFAGSCVQAHVQKEVACGWVAGGKGGGRSREQEGRTAMSGSLSLPMKKLPERNAATPVEAVPAKGSITHTGS